MQSITCILQGMTVQSTKASSKGGKGVVIFTSDILKQDDTVVATGPWTVLFRDRPS